MIASQAPGPKAKAAKEEPKPVQKNASELDDEMVRNAPTGAAAKESQFANIEHNKFPKIVCEIMFWFPR